MVVLDCSPDVLPPLTHTGALVCGCAHSPVVAPAHPPRYPTVAALAGFVIGIATFIYTFMRVKARCAHWACALGATLFVLLLGLLSDKLALLYPEGLLQSYVTLPWPLQ